MNSSAVVSVLLALGVAVVAVLWGLNEGRGGGGASASVLEEVQRAAEADINLIQGQLDQARDQIAQLEDENRNLQREMGVEKEAVAELLKEKDRLIARLDSHMAGGKPGENGRDWTDVEIDRRNEVELATVRIREQTLPAPLGYQIVDREQMRMAVGSSDRVVPESVAEAQSRAYAAMGFVTEGIDVRARSLDFLEGQLGAALYVGGSRMLFQTDGTTRSIHDRTSLAVELTRYMQDGHAGLFEKIAATAGNGDARAALWALSTGDSDMVKFRYVLREQASPVPAEDELPGSPTKMTREQFERIPSFIREEQLFPYALGKNFVERLYDEGGWEAVNLALQKPPLSTTEILHPEIYLADEPFQPDTYEWLTIETEVGALSPIWSDTAGEFRIALQLIHSAFLKRMTELGQPDVLDISEEIVSKGPEHFAEREGSKAAAGWRGDRYIVYPTPDGDSVYWRTRWADEKEAAEFAAAMRESLAFRHKIEVDAEGGWFEGNGRAVKVATMPENQILVIDTVRKDFGNLLDEHFARLTP